MSRIGNMPIKIPATVTVTLEGLVVKLSGPLGQLETIIRPEISVEQADGELLVKRQKDDIFSKSLHGLFRSLIANMVIGVEKGWTKKLELVGVGYRAEASEDKITLQVGFSHPIVIKALAGIKFTVADNTKITVSGIDKALVGQTAAGIRAIKPPEPYQGKGIRYSGEYVRRKAGKAAKTGAPGGPK